MKHLFFFLTCLLLSTGVFSQTIINEDYSLFADNTGDDNDYFGTCVSIFEDIAVVGAPNYNDSTNGADAGAVFVYIYDGTNDVWNLDVRLTASDGNANDQFGRQVCLYKDYIIVGAHNHSHSGLTQAGAVYIYERDGGGNWNETKITATNAAAYDHFGRAVSIWYPYAIVGAKDKDTYGSNSGTAYIYMCNSGSWTLDQQIFGSSLDAGDNFGHSVAINGTTAVIGAMYDDDNGYNAGAAYVFNRSTTWYQKAKLLASDGAANDWFSNCVHIWPTKTSGIHVAVGAMNEDDEGSNAGAVYMFRYNGTAYTQIDKLTDTNWGNAGDFYSNVALYNNYLVTGAYLNNTNYSDAGLGHLYSYNSVTDSWDLVCGLQHYSAASGDWLGRWVGISSNHVIIGAAADDNLNGTNAGAAYIFDLPSSKGSTSSINHQYDLNNQVCNISIYPNPFTDQITLESDSEILSVEIVDIYGKSIKTTSGNTTNLEIDLSNLSGGIYLIKLETNKGLFYKQIVKNN